MGLDYLDLMLMHAPGDPRTRADTWRALEDAVDKAREQHGTAGPRASPTMLGGRAMWGAAVQHRCEEGAPQGV